MRTRVLTLVVALALLFLAASPALAAADLSAALGYLRTQQNSDGGFGSGFAPASTIASTADVVLAIVAAGSDPNGFSRAEKTPLTFLAANAPQASSAGDLAKLILALVASGQNPSQFGGVDSVAKLEGLIGEDGRIGGDKDTFVSHLLAVLALRGAERPIPPAAVSYIRLAQQGNGAWAWDGTAATAPDTNTTAFAVQALVAAMEAPGSAAIANALTYYHGIQNDDGGWPYQNPSDFGTATDANSTAVSIQAIIAAGQDPAGSDWTRSGKTPLAALEALQNESGAFAWKADTPGDNLLATVQALPALAGKSFPLVPMGAGEALVVAPATVPVTGGIAVDPGWVAAAAGLALAGAGCVLRRKQ